MNIEQLNELIEASGFSVIGLRVMTGGNVVSAGDELANSLWLVSY